MPRATRLKNTDVKGLRGQKAANTAIKRSYICIIKRKMTKTMYETKCCKERLRRTRTKKTPMRDEYIQIKEKGDLGPYNYLCGVIKR